MSGSGQLPPCMCQGALEERLKVATIVRIPNNRYFVEKNAFENRILNRAVS